MLCYDAILNRVTVEVKNHMTLIKVRTAVIRWDKSKSNKKKREAHITWGSHNAKAEVGDGLGGVHTLGMAGLQTGTMLPDILFKVWLIYSKGRGPTTRWSKSMLFSSGGTTAVNLPKLSASRCKRAHVVEAWETSCGPMCGMTYRCGC